MTAQGDKLNRYGFIVDPRANKLEIKAAVEAMYGGGCDICQHLQLHGKG